MDENLIQYLNRRFSLASVEEGKCCPPFITISRETGCQSYKLANLLEKQLSNFAMHKWTIVTKEHIEAALLELHLDPHQVTSILDADERSHITEILKAFEAKPYRSDRRVRGILKQFIENLARNGHVIIIGRAGAMITKELTGGLHIRLVAPINWRIKSIQEQKALSSKAAREYVLASDERRAKLIGDFSKKRPLSTYWDLVINNEKITADEMAEMITTLLKQRNMIK